MRIGKLFSRSVIVIAATALGPLFAAACGSNAAETTTSTTGDEAASATGAGATTGAGTTGGGGSAPNPLTEDCAEICSWVSMIACTAWPNCATECPDALGAPDDCLDAFGALLGCWVANKDDFACTPFQVLPPFDCQPLEAAFQQCLSGSTGGADSGCAGEVCNSSDDTCSCKTSCASSEFKSACSSQGEAWACSCYDGKQLLGTCSQGLTHCDNFEGCCAPFFIVD